MFDDIITMEEVKAFRMRKFGQDDFMACVILVDNAEIEVRGKTLNEAYTKLDKLISANLGISEEIENRKLEIAQERM